MVIWCRGGRVRGHVANDRASVASAETRSRAQPPPPCCQRHTIRHRGDHSTTLISHRGPGRYTRTSSAAGFRGDGSTRARANLRARRRPEHTPDQPRLAPPGSRQATSQPRRTSCGAWARMQSDLHTLTGGERENGQPPAGRIRMRVAAEPAADLVCIPAPKSPRGNAPAPYGSDAAAGHG